MADIGDYFIAHARLSRRSLARFAELEPGDIDSAADGLGFGPLLRLDEAEEVLAELEEDEPEEDDEDSEEEAESSDEDG